MKVDGHPFLRCGAWPEPAWPTWVLSNHDVWRPVTRFAPVRHDQSHDLETGRRRALALSLAREACLGETLGVSEVSAARELVEAHQGPSVIAEHLAKVEADETRHAALAWRTLAWLLQGADEALVSEVSGVFVAGLSELLAELPQGVRERRVSPALSALGLLSPAQVREARLYAAHEVLLPALVTLLGAPHAMRAARELSRLALSA